MNDMRGLPGKDGSSKPIRSAGEGNGPTDAK
jgi:hypothetical protein